MVLEAFGEIIELLEPQTNLLKRRDGHENSWGLVWRGEGY